MAVVPFERPKKAAPEIPEHHRRAEELAEESGQPHGAGTAFCMACDHTWTAVMPIGTEEPFECPSCHSMRGRWRFEFSPPEDQVWTCNCGNTLFNITPRGTFCPNCGQYARF